jgi:protein O-mannosyl-transferase
MLIQRMTVLSGLFVFSGLAAYIWGRILFQTRPSMGATLMVLGLVVGTSLAVLSKENGALLPLLVLIAELTLLRHTIPIESRALRNFQWVALGIPVALITLYLGTKIPGLQAPPGFRGFSVNERFATQPLVLWEYVRHLLIPSVTSVTPFSDDRVAQNGWLDLGALISTLGWVIVLTTAFVLRFRLPILLFSLLFFLSGHALESSIINLELYYAHRNYVPAFGLYFGAAALFAYGVNAMPKVAIPGIAAYLVVFTSVLALTTSLWGQPTLAAEIWSRQHPESTRAHEFLASQYFEAGDAFSAREILEEGLLVDKTGSMSVLALYTCAFQEPRADCCVQTFGA